MTEANSSLPTPIEQVSSPPALACGARTFTLSDVLEAARCLGELEAFRRDWLARQAAADAAAAAGLEPDAATVEAATDAFRYERDLVSGEEAERWLAVRGLAFEDLVGYAARRIQAGLAPAAAPAEPTPESEALLRRDALLAPEFGRWARELARRLAAAAAAGVPLPDEATLGSYWPQLDAVHATAAAAAVTAERRQRALANDRLALTRVLFDRAEFDSVAAAREAILCAREDGATLAETAAANGFPCQREDCFLGDLPRAWAEVLTSARLGDPVMPAPGDDGIVVFAALQRIEPSLQQEPIRQRVDASLVEAHFRELESRHVRWCLNPDPSA